MGDESGQDSSCQSCNRGGNRGWRWCAGWVVKFARSSPRARGVVPLNGQETRQGIPCRWQEEQEKRKLLGFWKLGKGKCSLCEESLAHVCFSFLGSDRRAADELRLAGGKALKGVASPFFISIPTASLEPKALGRRDCGLRIFKEESLGFSTTSRGFLWASPG